MTKIKFMCFSSDSKSTSKDIVLQFNDECIKVSQNECHIGNILGYLSNSLNINRYINDFICNVIYINSVYKHATFEVKIVLFNSYCMSV